MSTSSDILGAAWHDPEANLATLGELQLVAKLSTAQAAELCGVSRRSYRRWRGQARPNPAAVRLLAVMGGYLPWPGWDGWEVADGLLFPPGFERGGIAPGEILGLPYLRAAVQEYRRAARVARPTPGASRWGY